MRNRGTRGPSPLKPVQPDDPPRRLCNECGAKFNPYKYKECPHCSRESGESDVPVVDPSDYVD